MTSDRTRGKSPQRTSQSGSGIKRRDLLLSGSSLVAASALTAAGLATSAQAQQQPTPPAGRRSNILVIFGDDIGQTNVSAYSWAIARRTSTASPAKG
jgi:arylsulfatase